MKRFFVWFFFIVTSVGFSLLSFCQTHFTCFFSSPPIPNLCLYWRQPLWYLDFSDNTWNLKYLYLNNVLNYTVLLNKTTATCCFASAPGMFTINQSKMPKCHPTPKFKAVWKEKIGIHSNACIMCSPAPKFKKATFKIFCNTNMIKWLCLKAASL